MPTRRRAPAAVALLLLLPLAPPAAADEAAVISRILETRAEAVVAIDAVMRTELQMGGQGQDDEASVEMNGAVVDPGGLVMVWNSRVSSNRVQEMMELMSSGMGHGGEFDLRMTPLSFEVHLPGRDEPVPAFLAASDSRLDVAFLQLEEPPPEPLAFVDLGQGGELAAGQPLYAVNRLSGSFDHAPFVESGRVVGRLEKPRPAWIVEGEFQGLGLPVFDAEGRPVGVLSTVLSSVAAERTASMMQGLGSFLNTGDGKTMGPLGVFVLAAPPVARAVELSKEQALERLEERRAAAQEEDAAGAQEGPRPETVDGEAAGEPQGEEPPPDGR